MPSQTCNVRHRPFVRPLLPWRGGRGDARRDPVVAARPLGRSRFPGGFSENAETPGDWSVMAIGVSGSVSDLRAACTWSGASYEPSGAVTKRAPSGVQPSHPQVLTEDNTS